MTTLRNVSGAGAPIQEGDARRRLGSAPNHQWAVSRDHVDMAVPAPAPVPMPLEATPQRLTIDLRRTAIVVIDMQNDFCAPGGWVDHLGVDYSPDRRPIKPLQRLLPALREAGVPVVWVNWGNRPDLLNMPPNQLHLYKPSGDGVGLGDPLPGHGARVLEKDSWAAAVVDELAPAPTDVRVDKYRISGFWDTPLDGILRNLGVNTLLFAGVNTDQCVACTLQDANFLGYGCVLVEDCCATTSPAFCTESTLFNVRKCYGFVTGSHDVLAGLANRA
ncbi:cysteine hydrolase [Pandoraea terrae]|uniref:Cysteine hydrolase n=1 Tax=Pandoraea terrae TaxID=1537710 RepID=A0A5E4T184_9BURK|nr:cysteine hydrolase family protein [Pandoraea terrae]VVD81545.1 cysteine hydrolase [Pandoraea terrae]